MADKLKMETKDIAQSNTKKIQELFPNCVKEIIDDSGNPKLAVDFDTLKQELSSSLIDDIKERYVFTWPLKSKSIYTANANIRKTLRPIKEKSVDFEKTKNLYIEGDNLDVLKLLRETYLNSLDVIYIDPPYNAGADLLYKNNYEMTDEEFAKANFDLDEDGYVMTLNSDTCGRYHTDWLNMMYSRLKVARDMLSESGIMIIAIDHNELANVIKLADEIFSENNRLGIVTVVHKPEGRNMEKFFATSNEFAIFYAKSKENASFQPVIFDEEVKKQYQWSDEKGPYKLNNYVRLGGGDHNLRVNKPHFWYPIYVSPDCKEVTLQEKNEYIKVLPYSASGQERTWKTKKETTEIAIKNGEITAIKDKDGKYVVCEKYREGQLVKTHWIGKKYNAINGGTKVLEDLMGCKTFDFPKSIYLMEDIFKLVSTKNSTILDFFSGSATSAHAIMNLNAEDGGKRKFIMVQLPYKCDENSEAFKNGFVTIPDIAETRIRLAGEKIKKENPMFTGELDTGFRVLKLDSSNMNDVYYNPKKMVQSLLDSTIDNVKPDRTSLDLLFQVMLELGIELSSRIEEKEISGKKYYLVNDNDLIACFDDDLNNDVLIEIAKLQPLYAVFKDKSFSTDSVGINNEQIFKTYSQGTKIKVL